MGFLILAR